VTRALKLKFPGGGPVTAVVLWQKQMLIDTLIGVHIVNIYVATWERETFNNADFVYELSDGRHVRIPDFYLSVTHIETCTLEARHHPVSNEWRRQYHPNLFGHSIVDVLIQRDPEIRAADSSAIKLDSGYYLMQESGAAQGILPDVFLVEAVDPLEMQSVFETAEWLATKASRARKATEQSGEPEPPITRDFKP